MIRVLGVFVVPDSPGGSTWSVVAFVLALFVLPAAVGLILRSVGARRGADAVPAHDAARRTDRTLAPNRLGVICAVALCVLIAVGLGMPKIAGGVIVVGLIGYVVFTSDPNEGSRWGP